ncbi:peptidoglycan-binding domain-containing protein [uncultured Tateyamaria sp.]|uniref:peptidoglycan-binding domain-containing protein n=1 Tax=uncultured Tateyamaria sp. TaxID=455651 RepID=UPI002626C129|nr:peptidoglycan-binding domain-containing protein [uncultured Tateyamaria sp.]
MTFRPLFPVLAAACIVAACAEDGAVTSTANVDPISLATAPPGAAPGTCWDKTVSPAVVETVTRKIQLQPAQISSDGRVQSPPIYKTETSQQVVQPRRETWYEILCDADVTPDFVASVQRALEARGFYSGQITGEMDARTRAAIGKYQAAEGLDSKTLSIGAARKLGLITVANPTAT